MAQGKVAEYEKWKEKLEMVSSNDGGQQSGRIASSKTVVVGPSGRAHEPILQTVDEFTSDQDILKTTTVIIGRCHGCGCVLHNESEIGAISTSDFAVCIECSQKKCTRCGQVVSFDGSLELLGKVYCRRHAVQEIAGYVLATVFVLGIIGCLIAVL